MGRRVSGTRAPGLRRERPDLRVRGWDATTPGPRTPDALRPGEWVDGTRRIKNRRSTPTAVVTLRVSPWVGSTRVVGWGGTGRGRGVTLPLNKRGCKSSVLIADSLCGSYTGTLVREPSGSRSLDPGRRRFSVSGSRWNREKGGAGGGWGWTMEDSHQFSLEVPSGSCRDVSRPGSHCDVVIGIDTGISGVASPSPVGCPSTDPSSSSCSRRD